MVNFPTSLDNFTNPSGSTDRMNAVSVPHAQQHADLNDAVEALEAKVGVDGSAVATSLDYKVSNKVTGPGSATVSNFAAFSTLNGKNVADSGYGASSFATSAQGAKADTAVQPARTLTINGVAYDLSADRSWTVSGGGLTRDLWYEVPSGAYASASTFTSTEASSGEATRLAELAERSLFTCTDTTGATRRVGYIKSASAASTTVTYVVVTNSDLASGDKNFRITPNRKVEDYVHRVSIPGEMIADASNPQGVWLLNLKVASYLLPVNSAVRTAAAGAGAACAWNVYAGASNLFSAAQDMTTSATFDEKRPTTNTMAVGDNISLRITSSAGATNKAQDFQAELFIVPQTLYTSQA